MGASKSNGITTPAIAEFDAKNPELQNTETPPSLCRWIYERLVDANVRPGTILDAGSGQGNLSRLFRPVSKVIEYEIVGGRDFFAAKRIACDLALCNPPWKETIRWLRHLATVVGRRKPIIFIAPALLLYGDKNGIFRLYLESDEAPVLSHVTALPRDTFVGVYCPSVILWFNLPEVRDVALVPSKHLVRQNDWEQAGATTPACI